MLSAVRGLQLGESHGGTPTLPHTGTHHSPGTCGSSLFITLLILISLYQGLAWPYDYRYLYNQCPGPEWNVMCRGCCEYDVIRCKCPLQGTPVGYAVPCCRNALNECDPCIIHPGCSIFENCKRCNNGTWGPRDDFFVKGKYCAECRPGWSGGDCLKCGGVIRKRQGHIVLESYPTNAHCEWTVQVDRAFTIDFRFMMLSLEFDHSCRYDYIEVRDGDSINSRVIGRFCGNNRPAPIQSSGNSLHVLFVADGYKNFDGFFATFQESSACSSSPCLHDGTCILDTSQSYHCGCLAGYTGQRCENVVGCRRPPVPVHGSTEGIFHHSGARVTFRCDPGFGLRGIRTAICLQDGTWSTPAPQCVPMVKLCAIPAKPVHGDHFLVYGPNDVIIALQYLCYRPYKLSGTHQRTCLPNNTWSGTPPTCGKVNNTLAEPGKDKGNDKARDTEKDKEKDAEKEKNTDKDIEKPKDKEKDYNTGIKEDVAGKDPDAGLRNTTVAGKDPDAGLRNTTVAGKDPDAGLRNTTVDGKDPDAGLRNTTVAGKDPDAGLRNTTVDGKDPDAGLRNTTVDGKDPDAGLRNTTVDGKDTDAGLRNTTVDGKDPDAGLRNTTVAGKDPDAGLRNTTVAGKDPDAGLRNTTVAGKDPDAGLRNTTVDGKDPDAGLRNTTVDGKDPDAGLRNTTVDGKKDGKDKNIDITLVNIPGRNKDKTSDKEKETGLDKPSGGTKDKVDSKETDDIVNTVEGERENDVGKTIADIDGSPDTGGDTDVIREIGKTTEIPEIVVVVEDKGQEEEKKKEDPVDKSSDPNIVDPNDLKPRGDTFAIDYTELKPRGDTFAIDYTELKPRGDTFAVEYTVTDVFGTNDIEQGMNTTMSKDIVKIFIPTRNNNTQFTPYSSGGQETERVVEKPHKDIGATKDTMASTSKPEEENTGKDSDKKTDDESDDEKRENQSISEESCPPLPQLYHGYQQVVPGLVPETVDFFCNHSYALSGDARRTCQPGGTWGGTQPLCVRACRESKVSELVRQRVLPPQAPSRKTPVHKLYSSSGFVKMFQSVGPTKVPPMLSQLPQGFHHLHTHIAYECASPFYQHSGSARRTCLKTGKWSGRHVSCSPVCGKHPTFDPQSPAESHWPWLAAIYQRPTNGAGTKLDKKASLAGSLKKGTGAELGAGVGSQGQDEASGWQLVCSGALVNQRSVVLAAHCVTELGKLYPLDAATVKVVMGKHYRSDLRETKGLQHLRVASISIHPNYDPLVLDSDLAVIKLLDKARIGEKVLPLCLPDIQGGEVTSREGLVTGWAPLPDPRIGEEEQARVGVQHLADVVPCEQQYARKGVPVSVTDNMLCGRQRPDYSPSNICPADTGGILILPAQTGFPQDPSLASPEGRDTSKGKWRLLGLVSFGYDQGECDPDLFTVYTHVANFKDWIESHMK
uniref:Inactive serine protease PAMR1 n=1 Tax=Oncorhynchus tshawytscha TaxID=74940 RepID=A0AAZ3NYG4_ONCTS